MYRLKDIPSGVAIRKFLRRNLNPPLGCTRCTFVRGTAKVLEDASLLKKVRVTGGLRENFLLTY